MKRLNFKTFVILAIFAACDCAFAQEKPKVPVQPMQQRSMREIVMMPVVFSVPGMDKVKVNSNLKYTDINDPNLLMDVYSPPDLKKGEKRPAVIFIHGGAGSATTPKDWGLYKSWGRLVAASGLTAVVFTHRLAAEKASLEDGASDVATAVSYARANADSLGIDRDRLCLAAYSAGGALLAPALRDKPPYIRCIVNFYAFMDIQQSGNLFTAHETKESLQKFSPINYLASDASKIPPIFIARAGLDQVPTMDDSIDRFIHEALTRNIALTVFNHPNGVHGFDNQNDDDRSREIIRSAIAFMAYHLTSVKDAGPSK